MKKLLIFTFVIVTPYLIDAQNVGIGTVNPDGTLHIENTGSSDSFIVFDESNDTTPFTIDQSGNVGVKGSADPLYAFRVFGRVKSVGFEDLSDIRYKKNISTLQNSLQKLINLRGVSYYWKTKEFPKHQFKTDRQLGLIAQEVEKIFPELVNSGADGYKSVEYSHLIPVLVEAIKEQQKIIISQQQKLTVLSETIDQQGTTLTKLIERFSKDFEDTTLQLEKKQ